MLHLLFIIISYAAMLLLLMPPTASGIISTAVMLALGIALIAYKKIHKNTFLHAFHRNRRFFHILIAAGIAALSGITFYNRWLLSSKIRSIASAFHLSVETLLLIASLTLSAFSVYFLYALLQIIAKQLSDIKPQSRFAIILKPCIVASVVTVLLAQLMIGAEAFYMGYFHFAWNVLIVSAVILFVYALLGRSILSISIGSGIFMLISTVNAYVYQFRDRLFAPADILSAGTAFSVVKNYSLFPIPAYILIGWGFFAAMPVFLRCSMPKFQSKPAVKTRLTLLAVCCVCAVGSYLYSTTLTTHHWLNEGAQYNGYILNFVSDFKEIAVKEPEQYDVEMIDQLAARYAADSDDSETAQYPHIIVIMDEAFSDLSVLGEFTTNTKVMPFISSLRENTISGYALTSVYGGNTANSEYEFLTGNTMAWLSPTVVPYQQYLRASTYSMVSYLKASCNYKCLAMHPYESSGWSRTAAYGYLGFDETYFIEDFPQADFVREYISDREMFEYLIETYEAQKEEPLFIFGVTMQNHGDYTYNGENYTQHISLDGFGDEYAEVEQYLSLLCETDRAVEYLISYFENVEEDVVIVFFGDHQPKLDEAFYEAIGNAAANSPDEQQKRYEVPFFVWANYDIEEAYIDCTSLNYLSTYVYDVAGIALPPYNRFLRELEETIPAINANGYYSLSAERYLTFDEADGDELQWLEWYEALQYNSIFDTACRNELLFPALE